MLILSLAHTWGPQSKLLMHPSETIHPCKLRLDQSSRQTFIVFTFWPSQ
jgi:hypothetical protein